MNIIKERDLRTIARMKRKKEIDKVIPLSTTDLWVPLIDEGAIITPSGDVDFIIRKGACERFFDAIPGDFVGHITMAHLNFASQFPILLGTWSKEDLRLTEIDDDGRLGLDVRLMLNKELHCVQDLLMMPYTLGTSARLLVLSKDSHWSERLGVDVVNDFWINEFGIVGDAGNVRSSGINLRRE